jgi:hypothetical protein
MYVRYVQVEADNTVKNSNSITGWVEADQAALIEIQADTNNVRYTMDDVTDPTQTVGMLFRVTDPPKTFLMEDVTRIRFTRGAAANGNLNFHIISGRDNL